VSNIDDVIDTLDIRPHGEIVAGMISRARVELTQLRSDIESYKDSFRVVETLIGKIFELADNGTSSIDIGPESPLWQIEADCSEWLNNQYNLTNSPAADVADQSL
jgi:hypothetical protein